MVIWRECALNLAIKWIVMKICRFDEFARKNHICFVARFAQQQHLQLSIDKECWLVMCWIVPCFLVAALPHLFVAPTDGHHCVLPVAIRTL